LTRTLLHLLAFREFDGSRFVVSRSSSGCADGGPPMTATQRYQS